MAHRLRVSLSTFHLLKAAEPQKAETNAAGEYQLIYSPSALGALVGSHTVTLSQSAPGADVTDLSKVISLPPEILKAKKEVDVKDGSNVIDLSFP